jgi:hypothetical protein
MVWQWGCFEVGMGEADGVMQNALKRECREAEVQGIGAEGRYKVLFIRKLTV